MELLAQSAPKPLTLADVATRLMLSKSTCSAVLTQLVRAGWVLRNDNSNQQTYTMGPGVMPLGRVAESGYPPTRDAVSEMRHTAAQLGRPMSIGVRVGDNVVVVESVAGRGHTIARTPTGISVRLAPPLGIVFVAWAPTHEQNAWIDQAPEASRERFGLVLDTVRDRGFAIERLTETGLFVRKLFAELGPSALAPGVDSILARHLVDLSIGDYLPHELQSAARHPVDIIAVPVFDDDGTVVMSLTAHIVADLSRREIDNIAAGLRSGADRIQTRLAQRRGRSERGQDGRE